MLVDAFTYCGELQVLKMRLELHAPFVDAFWIVEGDHTFSGQFKGWTFPSIRSQFCKWNDKINFIPFKAQIANLDFSQKDQEFNFNSPAWAIENAQRNTLHACLSNISYNDRAIISDVDEFFAPHTLQLLRTESFDVARLVLTNHYYYMNCRAIGENRNWSFPLAVSAEWWQSNPDVSSFRPFGEVSRYFADAGWHFSYLGGPKTISKKISSFSHTELDRPDINNLDNITNRMLRGEDCFGRNGHEFAFYPVSTYPTAIQKLMHKNRNLVRWTLY